MPEVKQYRYHVGLCNGSTERYLIYDPVKDKAREVSGFDQLAGYFMSLRDTLKGQIMVLRGIPGQSEESLRAEGPIDTKTLVDLLDYLDNNRCGEGILVG